MKVFEEQAKKQEAYQLHHVHFGGRKGIINAKNSIYYIPTYYSNAGLFLNL